MPINCCQFFFNKKNGSFPNSQCKSDDLLKYSITLSEIVLFSFQFSWEGRIACGAFSLSLNFAQMYGFQFSLGGKRFIWCFAFVTQSHSRE